MPDKFGRSEAIDKIDYDQKTKILTVKMRPGRKGRGATLRYAGVPVSVVEAFRGATSQGDFFNRHIRNIYDYIGG